MSKHGHFSFSKDPDVKVTSNLHTFSTQHGYLQSCTFVHFPALWPHSHTPLLSRSRTEHSTAVVRSHDWKKTEVSTSYTRARVSTEICRGCCYYATCHLSMSVHGGSGCDICWNFNTWVRYYPGALSLGLGAWKKLHVTAWKLISVMTFCEPFVCVSLWWRKRIWTEVEVY